MNSVNIIGDSHSGRMANIAFDNVQKNFALNKEYSTCSSVYYDRVVDHIDHNGNKIFHGMNSNLFSIKYDEKKLSIASTPGRSALNFDYDFYDYVDSWDKENSVVMPWFGYIDIKNWLPQKNLKNYKDVNEVVDIYVDKTVNKFKKSKIIFINPMPQFVVIIAARWANFSSDPDVPFEERHSMHLEFTSALKDKCLKMGLAEPIDISKILSCDWIDTNMQFKKPLKDLYNDHLKPEYYNKILTNILTEVGL